MMVAAGVVTACVVGLALLSGVLSDSSGGESKAPRSAVAIRPITGEPTTTFRVRARLLEPYPDKDWRGDNYHLLVRGPGGKRCNGTFHEAIGFFPTRGSRHVRGRLIPPTRGRRHAWCAGRYRGRVEFRDFHPLVVNGTEMRPRPVGKFTFRVKRSD